MSSKNWTIMFIISLFLLGASVAGLNVVTDSFGIFGDPIMKWDAYNYTKNPRTAKITYMDENFEKYDSFIIGSSSTSSFPVEQLNTYLDANFYNMFMYGADIYDVERISTYVIENYNVKNLVLNIGVKNAVEFDIEPNKLLDNLHIKTDPDTIDFFEFYTKYLFANPKFGFEKINHYVHNDYLQKYYDVFNPVTGAYDKSLRDIQRIQDMESYLVDYPVFANYPTVDFGFPYIDEMEASVKTIVDLCEANNIHFNVVFYPMYDDYVKPFPIEQVTEIYERISAITEFWDFSLSQLSTDGRFFYDSTHFRNSLGTMALAKMFNDTSIYYPEDIGVYVTPENAKEQAARYQEEFIFDDTSYTVKLPILMYHHIAEESIGEATIALEAFREQIKTIHESDYTTVSLAEVKAYVEQGIDLPENPVLITFDDGYLSNYEYAFPLLKEYGMKATIFVIGSSVGKDTYKNTTNPIIPHFTFKQAEEMLESGLIEIQSHTYDMHQWQPFEEDIARRSASMFEGERQEDFVEIVQKDFMQSKSDIETFTQSRVFALAYPLGEYSDLTEVVYSQLGVDITLSTEKGVNTLIKGVPQSLRAMKRNSVNGDVTPEMLFEILEP